MEASLGSLVVSLEANTVRFESALNKAEYQAKQSMDKLAGILGISLSIGGIEELARGSIDAISHLNDLSAATDISVGKLAGLKLVSIEVGSNLDTTARAIDFLSKNIGKNAEAYRSIGITAKEPLEAFKQLSDLFVSIRDPQERAAVMARALGKSWQDAAPMLAMGGQKIGEIVDRGEKLSGVTDANAESVKRFNDTLKELETAGSGVITNIITPLLPLLQVLAKNLEDVATSDDKVSKGLPFFVEQAGHAVIVLGDFAFVIEHTAILAGGFVAQLHELGVILNTTKWNAPIDWSAYKSIGANMTADLAAATEAQAAWQSSIQNANTNSVAAAKKVSADKLQVQQDYQDASLMVLQFYLGKSVAVQQKAQFDLAKAYGMQTAGLPNQAAIDKFAQGSAGHQVSLDISGKQLLIGLENTYQNELAKRNDLMNSPGMSASEKALADATRTAAEQAQKVRIELEKIESINLAKVAASTSMTDSDKVSASAKVVVEYHKNLAQVNIDLDKQTAALRAQAVQIDKNNASWEYGAKVALRTYLDEVENVAKSTEAMMTKAFKGMDDALVNFVMTGKLDFKSLTDSIIADLIRIQAQQNITGPLAKMAMGIMGGGLSLDGGMPAANGAWFDNGAAHFALGGIVNSPTPFTFANGGGFSSGLMGEAGPEAIMPLKRAADGSLGIVASGGGSAAPNVIIQVLNQSGTQVTAKPASAPQFNGSEWVLGVVLQAANTNPSFRNAMGIGR